MPVICRLVVPAQQGRRAFCLLRSSSTSASIQQLIFPSNFSDATTAATTSWPRTSPPPLPRRRRSRHSLHFSFSTWSNNNNHDYLDYDDDASSSNQRLHHRQRIVITPGGTSSKHKKNDTKKKKSRIQQQQQQDRPFLDRIQLQTRGGTGGAGCISYHRLGSYKKRPCGGHGGSGGNVYLVVDPTLSSLAMTKHHYFGQDGTRGGVNGRNGKNGKHVYVRVPQGVIVRRVMEYEEMMERMSLGGESIEDIVVGEEEDEEDASEFGDQSFVSEDESFNEHDLDGEYEHDGDDGDDHELEEEEEEGGDESDDDYQDSDSNDYDGDSESDYEDVNETINAQEEDEEEEEDDDDFDTQYEQMISTKRSRRRAGGSGGSSITPSDYNEVVNQGVRSEDGMFYWSSPDTTNADVDVNERQMMMASMAYDDDNSNGSYPSRKKVFLADLDQPNSTLLVAQGGKAGVGNQAYANRPYFSNMEANAAKKSIPGMGECTYLELELKLIADVGLVGFPNAGKSSLLSAMSRAKPKIASYPFTTLHPLVGSIQYRDGYQIVVADVPGLIEGAAEGRGRGIEFLRHIERTKVLVYMVDSAGVDGRDPVSDLKVLGKELREYGSSGIFGKNEIEGEGGEYEEEMRRRRREIMNRPSLILANKMDLIPEVDANIGRREEIIFLLGQAAEEVGIVCDPGDIMGISAGVTGEGLQALSKQLRRTVLDL